MKLNVGDLWIHRQFRDLFVLVLDPVVGSTMVVNGETRTVKVIPRNTLGFSGGSVNDEFDRGEDWIYVGGHVR